MPQPRILAIGGSDSGGGAGIEADIKTITVLGGYAMTAITAVTAQDTLGVHGVAPVPPGIIHRAITAVLDDIGSDAIKIGMLAGAAQAEAVADALLQRPSLPPLIIDPVIRSSSGTALLDETGRAVLTGRLLPRAMLITPNLPEAEMLLDREIADPEAMAAAGEALRDAGAANVLIKGGHGAGEILTDILVHAGGVTAFTARRQATHHTHGTGCTLAAAIATALAMGMSIVDAVEFGHTYLQRALAAAPGFGHGAGPLGHAAAAGLEPGLRPGNAQGAD